MARLKLSAPWDIYYREVDAMFKNDEEIQVVYDEDELTLKLYVMDNVAKAEALAHLMPLSKDFGGTILSIEVIPPNGDTRKLLRVKEGENYYQQHLFDNALRGNGAFLNARTVGGALGFNACYVVFRNEVVQYFTDNLADINGLCSTLYQEIAKDIFVEMPGVFYCTGRGTSVPNEWLSF